jgi:hypothetical protein
LQDIGRNDIIKVVEIPLEALLLSSGSLVKNEVMAEKIAL